MIYTVAGLPPADNRREWLLLPFAPICFAAQCPDAGCGVPVVDTLATCSNTYGGHEDNLWTSEAGSTTWLTLQADPLECV
jgi:hypothetical protein